MDLIFCHVWSSIGMFDLKEALRLKKLEHPNIIKCFAWESSSTESAWTQLSSPVGTNGYIAPEVFRPGEKTSVKMDIFSLGCVFYYTLTDKCHPFGSVEHLKKCQGNINHGQEPSLDVFLKCAWSKPIIREMLSFHPKQRPSGKRVLEALEVRELVHCSKLEFRRMPSVLLSPGC